MTEDRGKLLLPFIVTVAVGCHLIRPKPPATQPSPPPTTQPGRWDEFALPDTFTNPWTQRPWEPGTIRIVLAGYGGRVREIVYPPMPHGFKVPRGWEGSITIAATIKAEWVAECAERLGVDAFELGLRIMGQKNPLNGRTLLLDITWALLPRANAQAMKIPLIDDAYLVPVRHNRDVRVWVTFRIEAADWEE